MLANFLLQVCGFETLDTGGWININMLVVLASVMVAALIYALGNLLPAGKREALRGVANYEILEAFVSLALVFVLILFSGFACNAGAALVGSTSYSNLFNSVEGYLGNLLFVNGLNLISNFFTTSIQLGLVSNVMQALLGPFGQGLQNIGSAAGQLIASQTGRSILPDWVNATVSPSVGTLFDEYSALFSEFYTGFLFVSFGTLFIPLLLLPIIEAGALTVIAPVAIVCRALAFFGPQFRQVSNLFIALAMGFYFVFPLTLALDSYVASCLNIGIGTPISGASCAGYTSNFVNYLGTATNPTYSLPQISSSVFTSSAQLPVNSMVLPSFLSGGLPLSLSLPFGVFGGAVGGLNLNIVLDVPSIAATDGQTVAAYMFLSVVLITIDMAITAGFVQGVAKGLDAMGDWFGQRGGFWEG